MRRRIAAAALVVVLAASCSPAHPERSAPLDRNSPEHRATPGAEVREDPAVDDDAGVVVDAGAGAGEPAGDRGSAPVAETAAPVGTDPPELLPMPIVEIALGQVDQGFAESQGLSGGLGYPVVMVTSSADSGPGTYRDAISSGDRIVRFDPRLDGATIALEDAVETAASNLTIDGSGVSVTVTDHATRFTGTNIVVAGLTFSNNTATEEEDAITFRNPETTQVFGLFGNTFDHAADGLVDVIWNRGHDVYGTICGNVFRHHDKAVLLDSGDDDREGGHYYVTFCRNYWVDVYQRMPLSRWGSVHQYNSVFERYGKPDGTGGGSKSGGDGEGVSQHLLEGNMVFPRARGEVTFDGQTVSSPRAEWAAPQLDTDGAVRVEGNLLGMTGDIVATETEHDVDEVFTPPYEYTVLPASESLAGAVRRYAGTCVPSGRIGAVNPCAPLLVIEDRRLFVDIRPSVEGAEMAPILAVEVVIGDQRFAAVPDGTRWSADLGALEPGVTIAWVEVTFVDGRRSTSDVVVASLD